MFEDITPGLRKLNVGCGFDKREGYVNVDLQPFHEPDLVADVLDLHMVPSNWAEELLAFDVIEHFKRLQTIEGLLEWNRVLKPGGVLRLSTTYLTGLMHRITYDWFGSIASHKELILNLFSSQAYDGDFHLTAFTEKLMRYYLWSGGYEIDTIRIKDNWLFDVIAVKAVDYSFADLMEIRADDVYVTELYRRILKREPDASGLSEKLAALTSGAQTRAATRKGFLHSSEREELMTARAPAFELLFDSA